MREIKFRAKATQDYDTNTDGVEKGDWVYGYYYFCRNREIGIIVTDLSAESGELGSGIVQVEIEVDCKTLGQFTGLSDKTAKEIYKGDILKDEDKLRKVTCGLGCFNAPLTKKDWAWEWNNINLNHFYMANAELYKHYTIEIIGNIHENPELLK